MPKIPTKYDFEQLIAEAQVRIGTPTVEEYMLKVAARIGWPIPAADRLRVGAGLAMLVLGIEGGLDKESR